jgi:hypothetical protein
MADVRRAPFVDVAMLYLLGGFGETNNNYGGFSVLRPSFALIWLDLPSIVLFVAIRGRCLSLLSVACRCFVLSPFFDLFLILIFDQFREWRLGFSWCTSTLCSDCENDGT